MGTAFFGGVGGADGDGLEDEDKAATDAAGSSECARPSRQR